MIVVTGARGFIGSNMVEKLNQEGYQDIILVDELENKRKDINTKPLKYKQLIDRNLFLEWFSKNAQDVSFVYHLGARTDTAEFDESIFDELNVSYSKEIWKICVLNQIPLVYASSAATYGDGALGFDDTCNIKMLKPLNPYGNSKQLFDLWVKEQKMTPPCYAGLKFFNVYGKGEMHKDRMASIVFHAFNQIKKTGVMKLFQSHKAAYQNGEQKRDFIYVKDVVNMAYFFQKQYTGKVIVENGLYNIGTGKARSYNDLILAVFSSLNTAPSISYIPIPEDIRNTYQYFTEAKMAKLHSAGYDELPFSLEEGIEDYVQNYLTT